MRKAYKPQSKQTRLTNTYRKKTIDPGVDFNIKKDGDDLENIDEYWNMAEYVMDDDTETDMSTKIPKDALNVIKKHTFDNLESSGIEDVMNIPTDGSKENTRNLEDSTLFDLNEIRESVSKKVKQYTTENDQSSEHKNEDNKSVVQDIVEQEDGESNKSASSEEDVEQEYGNSNESVGNEDESFGNKDDGSTSQDKPSTSENTNNEESETSESAVQLNEVSEDEYHTSMNAISNTSGLSTINVQEKEVVAMAGQAKRNKTNEKEKMSVKKEEKNKMSVDRSDKKEGRKNTKEKRRVEESDKKESDSDKNKEKVSDKKKNKMSVEESNKKEHTRNKRNREDKAHDKESNIIRGKDNKLYGMTKITNLYNGVSGLEPLITKKSLESGILFLNPNSCVYDETAGCSFTIYILKGSIQMNVNGDTFDLKRESCFYVNEGSTYNMLDNSRDGTSIFITFRVR